MVAEGVILDHEDTSSYDLTVTATDAGGLSIDTPLTVNVTDVNEGPTDINWSNDTIAENSAAGTVVANIEITDVDEGDSHTVELSGEGAENFEIVDGQLVVAEGADLDFETATSHDLTLTVTDTGGNVATETVSINVTDVIENQAPIDLVVTGTVQGSETAQGENLLVNGSFEAEDVADGDFDQLSNIEGWEVADTAEIWDSLQGREGTDGEQFLELDSHNDVDSISQDVQTVEGETYTLTFDSSQRDADGSSESQVEVYWNGELVDTIEAGSTEWENFSFEVEGTGGMDTLEFREPASDNDNRGSFLDNISLVSNNTLVEDNEGVQVDENAAAGTHVADLAGIDPDAGDTLTFTLVDGEGNPVEDDNFEIVGDKIVVKDGADIDFEETESLSLNVQVADQHGATHIEEVTIDVNDIVEPEAAPVDAFQESDGLLVIEAENFHNSEAAADGQSFVTSDVYGESAVHFDDGEDGRGAWKDGDQVEAEGAELTYEVNFETPGTYYVHVRGDAEDGNSGNADSVHIGFDGDVITGEGGLTGFGGANGLAWGNHETGTGNVIAIEVTEPGSHTISLYPREDGVTVDKLLFTTDPDFEPSGEGPAESPRVEPVTEEAVAEVEAPSIDLGQFDQADGGRVFDLDNGDNQRNFTRGDDGIEETSLDGTQNPGAEWQGAGDDTIHGNGGDDLLFAGAGNDDVRGGEGNDELHGGTGNDTLEGGFGDDQLVGGDGVDRALFDGNRSDYTVAQNEDGTFSVTDNRDNNNEGTDTTHSVEVFQFDDVALDQSTVVDYDAPSIEPTIADLEIDTDNTIQGDQGGNFLNFNNQGNEHFEGRGGDDTIFGGNGDDVIDGGLGNDTLHGDAGNDLFTFEAGDGNDTVHGGEGGGWTDAIELENVTDSSFGNSWTLTLDQGEITGQDNGALTLSDDSAGSIDFEDGSSIDFYQIEQIQW